MRRPNQWEPGPRHARERRGGVLAVALYLIPNLLVVGWLLLRLLR